MSKTLKAASLKNKPLTWIINSHELLKRKSGLLPTLPLIKSDSQTTGLPVADNWIDEDGLYHTRPLNVDNLPYYESYKA